MNSNYQKFLEVKKSAGLHSPSVFELKNDLQIDVEVDACFLCNPYALDLFIERYKETDLIDYIKFYPPQNKILSKILSKSINIPFDNILIGNGAIQIIEILTREFENKKKCVITPTFSTYYEYDFDNIFFYKLDKNNNFDIDIGNLIDFCKRNEVEVLFIVNPNNPTGTIIPKNDLYKILNSLSDIKIVVDESFIDFYDNNQSLERDITTFNNLVVIRSLSKDFGIAGLRLGYMISEPNFIYKILKKYGLCWNINGVAQFFLELFVEEQFKKDYEKSRQKYLNYREIFYQNLSSLKNLRVYKSHANFFILDCGEHINTVFADLLFNNKIYTRILNDKLDLDQTFLRIACGTEEDNYKVFLALKEIDNKI